MLGWLNPAQLRRLAGVQPSHMGRVGPRKKVIIIKKNEKKYSKKLFKKISVIFRKFSLHFNQYRFVFLYCKDTNPVLKYLVFVKT
jgi:hypothetical protein